MHIHVVPNRGSTPTILLRESFRDGEKVGKRTLANLSSLSMEQVEAMRAGKSCGRLPRVSKSPHRGPTAMCRP